MRMGSVGDGLGLEIVCVKQRRGGLTPRQWISWSDDGFVWGRSNLPFCCKQIKHSRTSRIAVIDLGLTVNQKGRFASRYACEENFIRYRVLWPTNALYTLASSSPRPMTSADLVRPFRFRPRASGRQSRFVTSSCRTTQCGLMNL